MSNDAKLGLVIGVGIVIALGAVYNRPDASNGVAGMRPEGSAVNAVGTTRPDDLYRLTGGAGGRDDGPTVPDQPGEDPGR
ncbi:hypothetical protein AYO44_13095 [Planctomycetaceae bacterium SCGC AG-212-F19]|nr:hypothetical protein AYO44_13095 [Planctomycetaceae bacterium SCGC AG-212-F19]